MGQQGTADPRSPDARIHDQIIDMNVQPARERPYRPISDHSDPAIHRPGTDQLIAVLGLASHRLKELRFGQRAQFGD